MWCVGGMGMEGGDGLICVGGMMAIYDLACGVFFFWDDQCMRYLPGHEERVWTA